MTCVDFSSATLTHWLFTRLLTFNQVKFERADESQIDLCWCLKTSYWERFFRFYLYFFLAQFSPLTLSFVFSKGSNWFQLNVLYKSTLRGFHSAKTKLKAITLSWFDKHTMLEFFLNILNDISSPEFLCCGFALKSIALVL